MSNIDIAFAAIEAGTLSDDAKLRLGSGYYNNLTDPDEVAEHFVLRYSVYRAWTQKKERTTFEKWDMYSIVHSKTSDELRTMLSELREET
jgi:hypothetical protein